MDQLNVFREFLEKVQRILTSSSNHQVVLDALRALVDGRPANLQDGTEIQALSGLGNQAYGQDPPESYSQAMTALLTWALRKYPNQSRYVKKIFPSELANERDIWEIMALFDGPNGYNQRLIGNGLYHDGVHIAYCDPPETGFIPIVPLPTVRLTSERQSVQSLDEDLSYIPDFLRGSSTARAVVAIYCRFGWLRLSVDCLCLYVDADDTTSLENSIASLTELVIIKEAKFRDGMDNLSKAKKILQLEEGPGHVGTSKRRYELLKKVDKNPIPRIVRVNGRLYHGQSISLMGDESKGSVGVFLSPCGVEEPKTYALTAYHVVPFKTANEKRVITPGGLDTLTQLQEAVDYPAKSEEEIGALLKQQEKVCGHAEYGHIGTTQEGWRSDFALIRLDGHWQGENGKWYRDQMADTYAITEPSKSSNFTGTRGIVGSTTPLAGQIVYKDGATTGCTAGVIGSHKAVCFMPGTTDKFDVVRADFITITPLSDPVCKSGDSGSGVFLPAPHKDGWEFAGQLVLRLIEQETRHVASGVEPIKKDDHYVGLMIPQDQIFKSLKEHTGMSWELSS